MDEELQQLLDNAEPGVAEAMAVFEVADAAYVAAAESAAPAFPLDYTGTSSYTE